MKLVNNDKVRRIVRISTVIIDESENLKPLSDEKIDSVIEEAINIIGTECLPEEFQKCQNELKSKYMIKCNKGTQILNDYEQEEWYTERKDSIDPVFWTRYKNYLIDEKGFSPNVVSRLNNETLDQSLMNCLLDPLTKACVLRRGLVIGDVQSGKTSTYIGLICKAADAGFRVFILLTGTIESLRKQTQERVEEGFIGINMSDSKRVGVGLDNQPIRASSFTSRNSDFRKNKKEIAVALSDKNAVVFVIKKQKNVLEKLTEWLLELNAYNSGKIDLPMLMIDDEADNASINTSKSKEDPTTINRLIRRLANIFTRSNYVGFTATPFANVFIDPETTEEMENQDLFPEDFIVSLPVPSNYIGAEKIFSENGEHHSQLIYIKDAGITEEDGFSFWSGHKKDWNGELPASLTDAVYSFYIVNAIRDLRGDRKAHRSMLVNISRFTGVQNHIAAEIDIIHKKAYNEIKFNLGGSHEEAMKSPVLKRIHELWKEHFSSAESDWNDIKEILLESIEPVMIKVVNSARGSDKLVYPANEGIRVIAVGGLALSRGLTLEGLIISYFYRNTCTYDVLMQMGRWFGYRHGYEDLFRIWIGESSARWYAEIAAATEELKSDMRIMNEEQRTPREFGIRVRNDSEELQITSSNKMRNTKEETIRYSYFGDIIETPYLVLDSEIQKKNYYQVKDFIESLVADGMTFEKPEKSEGKPRYIIQCVKKNRIYGLLENLSISEFNNRFRREQIMKFLSECDDECIDLFDVVFIEGTSQKAVSIAEKKIYPITRNNCSASVEDNRLNIGQRGKLGGLTDGMAGIVDMNGMTAEEITESAKAQFKKYYENKKKTKKKEEFKSYPGETWFRFVKNRRPVLIIYLIDVQGQENQKVVFEKLEKDMNGIPCVGFAMGFPENEEISYAEYATYQANRTYNWFENHDILMESEEE